MKRQIFCLYDAPQTYEREGIGRGFHWHLWKKLAQEFLLPPIMPFFSKPLPDVAKKEIKKKTKPKTNDPLIRVGKYWLSEARCAQIRLWVSKLPANCILIAAGDIATNLLTEGACDSVFTYNGSIFERPDGRIVVPVIGPEMVAKSVDNTYYTSAALRRVMGLANGSIVREERKCRVCHTWRDWLELKEAIGDAPFTTAIDLETNNYTILSFGLVTPDGVAWCIPMFSPESGLSKTGYLEKWAKDEYEEIQATCSALLKRSGMRLIFQNGYYDLTYLFWKWMVWIPRANIYDTMVGAHIIHPAADKDLATLAQLHLPWYVHWKGEGKQDNIKTPEQWEKFWIYNGMDCHHTLEIAASQEIVMKQKGLWHACEMRHEAYIPTLEMGSYGWKIDVEKQQELLREVDGVMHYPLEWLSKAGIQWSSSPQMIKLLYTTLGIKPILDRKTKRPTTDAEAIDAISKREDLEPLAVPILRRLQRVRSLKTIRDGIGFRLSEGGRAYSSIQIAATDTFRLNSKKHIFGTGHNFQNKSIGNTFDEKKGIRILPSSEDWEPNAREIFQYEPGTVGFECDQERADLQVVVWEADDLELKQMLRAGEDMHAHNAVAMFGGTYEQHRKSPQRQLMKAGVHATNYFVMANTLAKTLGVTVKEAEAFIRRWLQIHPGIDRWHKRTRLALERDLAVWNQFGYRRLYLDRYSIQLLQNALAWIAQSTVAIVSQQALIKFNATVPRNEGRILHQNHDSLNPQIIASKAAFWKPQLAGILANPVPYRDPLVIGWSVKECVGNWGTIKNEK